MLEFLSSSWAAAQRGAGLSLLRLDVANFLF